MKESNLLIKQRKRKLYRQKRERKTSFGEMLQIDGCFDYWFGRKSKKACLINLIDDATSYNLCYFDEQETIRAATIVLWLLIKKWGIPQSIIDDYSYELVTRKVNNDWTVKYKAKTYQILRKNFCPAKSTISVKETFSGKIILLFKNQELSYKIT